MDHRSSLSSRTIWNAAGSLVATTGRIVSAIVIARQLGPDLAGKYAFLVVLAEFVTQLVSFGLPSTLSRYIAAAVGKGSQSELAELVQWIVRRYAVFTAIGVVAVSIGISGYALTTNLLLGLFLLALNCYTLVHAYLSGIQNFRRLATVNLFAGLTLVVAQPVGVALFGLNGALAGGIISSFMSLIALKPILSTVLNENVQLEAKLASIELKRYALFTWMAALVSSIVWSRTEVFFLSHYSTHAEAGFFNVSVTLHSGVLMVGGLLAGGMTPHFSSLVGGGSKDILQRDYCRFVSMVALFNFPLCIGGAAVMPELLPLIYGEQYRPAIQTATVLMISGVLCIAWVSTSITYAYGKSDYIFNVALMCALVMLAGCAAFIPYYGSAGGAWVRFGVQALSTISGTVIVHHFLRVIPPYRTLMRIAIAATLCALVARIVILQFPNDVFALAVAICAGALTYFLALRVLCPIPISDRQAYVRLASRLPGRAAQYAVPFTKWLFALPI